MHADSSTVSAEDLATLEANVHIAHLYQANDGQKQIAVRNENEAAGSLNSVSTVTDPASVPEVSTDEKTVTVNVTAKDASGVDTASNSGLVEITYDTEALTLVDVKEHAAYHSTVKADGSVVLAYADLEALDTLATLTFAAKTTDDTVVHIATKHLNDQKPAYDEALTIRFAHTNTEIRDAKEATCLEDGYTGDTYCLDCGKLVKKGETIPALGSRLWAVDGHQGSHLHRRRHERAQLLSLRRKGDGSHPRQLSVSGIYRCGSEQMVSRSH